MSHSFHQSILRAYDIRGIISQTLHIRDAYFLGRKFAADIFDQYNSKRIVIGYDGRLSSKILEKELIEGLKDGGSDIITIGLCPSPMLYFASKTLNCDGAIMITGSHNPSNYNGFKILSRDESYYGKKIINLANKKIKSTLREKSNINEFYMKDIYLNTLTNSLGKISNKLKIIWDPANGAASGVLKSLIKIIPGKHLILNDKIDGTFPSHHPDPTVEENLEQLKTIVKKEKADIGIAFDGDGDRIGVVDSNSKFIAGDQLLLVFAGELLKENKGATIISDVKASDTTFKEIRNLGGKPIMWKTGHSLIKSKMKETGALLAGEMSGHIFFADKYFGFDDAIYASLRLLEIISRNRTIKNYLKPFSQLASTPEIKITCADKIKFSIIKKCTIIVKKKYKKFSLIDGIRVQNKYGWWLLRASNTTPNLIVRCESSSKEKLNHLLREVEDILLLAGIKIKLKI